MTLQQAVVWTALPNGWKTSGTVAKLSVFVAPRLAGSSTLTDYIFEHWPKFLAGQSGGAVSFTVTFEGFAPAVATVVSPKPVIADWTALFPEPNLTAVNDFQYTDLSAAPIHSFDAAKLHDFTKAVYTAVATSDATVFPPASLLWKYLPAEVNNNHGAAGWKYVQAAFAYHQLPTTLPAGTGFDPSYTPPVPLFDFHQTLATLHSYPAILRRLGLVFDLTFDVPSGLGPTPNVRVEPAWDPAPSATGYLDVSPSTSCIVTTKVFRARPRGPDFGNGMLALNDTSRYSVIGLDTDGIADRLQLLAQVMSESSLAADSREFGVPAMRTAGPSIIRTGWGEQPSKGAGLDLQDLLDTQKSNNALVEAFITSKSGPLPVFNTEDLVRGYRVDVLPASEPSPTWRSLCWRKGTYVLGPSGSQRTLTITDEGSVSPGASSPSQLRTDGGTGAVVPNPPDIYVHERLARWKGWSLAASRPGSAGVGSGTDLQEGGTNPVPPGTSTVNPPQVSVVMTPPTTGSNLLPKLRYGSLYRFRVRGADLAGNGPPAASPDASSASPAGSHLRYEPVESPQLAPIAPPVPGEGTEIVVLLNYTPSVPTSPTPNGRWVFPPKVSQFSCEEHGMLDGFVEGSPPDPTKPPSGAAATYTLLSQRDPLRLNDVAGVEFYGANLDSTGTATVGSPYLPGLSKVAVPWLPDPLAAGLCLAGLPTKVGFVTRFYEGGPWPDPAPLLLQLEGGAAFAESYTAATSSSSAIETITLPPGAVLDLAYSSALFPGAVSASGRLLGLYILAIWQWIAEAGLSSSELKTLEEAANAGLCWQLSPARGLALVHAVRVPLLAPTFSTPSTSRTLGSTKAALSDPGFELSIETTSSLDVLASWTDPVDDPTQPAPGMVSYSANAFKLTVEPGFTLAGGPEATQDFYDTKHHTVEYSAVGTSRFNGYFRQTQSATFSGTTPVVVSPTYGLDPASVRLTLLSSHSSDAAVQLSSSDFTVDATAGSVALTSAGVTAVGGKAVEVSFIPSDTLAGPAASVPVLSTTRPTAPSVLRVVPAWQLTGPSGMLDKSGIVVTRRGNFLRVYLDRPWYSTGAGELLGVVTLTTAGLPTDEQMAYTTVVGADPVYDAIFSGWGNFTGPSNLTNLATVPAVPGRPAYSSPPQLTLLEDTSGSVYDVWPYAVTFDSKSERWFADVQLSFGDQAVVGPDGAYPPMLVRLALARFQPWSLEGVEVSPVVLASIALPVPDRVVLVTKGDVANAVHVQVEGFGYVGFRPAAFNTPGDPESGLSPTQDVDEVYGGPTMVVEVQVQDTSSGLSGDLAWISAPSTSPVALSAPGDNGPYLAWSGSVPIPSSGTKMRLRVSEIDFYTGSAAPTSVDTTYRRPFVVHIPLG